MDGAPESELRATDPEPHAASSFVLRATSGHLVEGEPAPGELRVELSRLPDDVSVFSLEGEMDMGNASEFGRVLGGNAGPGGTIIELSRLSFMDSTGINELVRLAQTVKAAGGAMVLAAPHPNLVRIFEIVNLGELMPVVASLEAAIDRASQTTRSPELV